jgi:hypothetical protein
VIFQSSQTIISTHFNFFDFPKIGKVRDVTQPEQPKGTIYSMTMLVAMAEHRRHDKARQRAERTPWVVAIACTVAVFQTTRAPKGLSIESDTVPICEAYATPTREPRQHGAWGQSWGW